MFKNSGVLLNPLYNSLKPSFSHSGLIRRCRSTKSAIHAALHNPEYEDERHSSRSRRSREKGGLAHGTARGHYSPLKAPFAGDRKRESDLESDFPRENHYGKKESRSGRRNGTSGSGELEHEDRGRENSSRNDAVSSGRRRNTNLTDGDFRHLKRENNSRGRSSYNFTGQRDESFPSMGGSQQQDQGPLTLPYTTPASEFLYGQGVVIAALRAGRREFYKLYMFRGSRDRDKQSKDKEMEALAHKANVPVEKIGTEKYRLLDRMSEGRPHNGFVLEASPLPRLPVTGFDRLDRPGQQFLAFLGRQSLEDEKINGIDPRIKYNGAGAFPRFPFVLLLDGVLDPQNLGAIMRSAFFFGVDAIALTTNRTAPLSPAALKASAGASEGLPILTVDQTRAFLMECKKNGWKVYASQADPASYSKSRTHGLRHLTTSTFVSDVNRRPCILVMGSEGQGLYKDVQGAADNTISIEGPREGGLGIDSLNVSVAAGLLCQSFLREPREPRKVTEQYTALDIQERLF